MASLCVRVYAGDGSAQGGRRSLPEAKGDCTLKRADNLYGHMTYRPLSAVEQRVLSKALDDSRHHAKRGLTPPGTSGPGKGADMLHHVPQQRVGLFVPHGGYAQEGRKGGRKLASAGSLSSGTLEWR